MWSVLVISVPSERPAAHWGKLTPRARKQLICLKNLVAARRHISPNRAVQLEAPDCGLGPTHGCNGASLGRGAAVQRVLLFPSRGPPVADRSVSRDGSR